MPNIMGSFLFSTLLAVSLTAASGPVVELPIAGAPLSDEALAAIEQLPGVSAAALDREVLSLEVAPD